MLHLNTTPDTADTYCEAEYAALCRAVQRTNLGDPLTAIQTSVTTAYLALGQDWRQEGRQLLRELGLGGAGESWMVAARA